MQNTASPSPVFSRRMLLSAMPAAFLVAGCVPGSKAISGPWANAAVDSRRVIDHSAWDAFLTRYVQASADGINRVDYKGAAGVDRAMLKPYLVAMQAIVPSQYNRAEQFAYWVNLYNAATVDLILEAYPVKSIRNLGFASSGPWDKKILTVDGFPLSLNNIEHGILRPLWQDPRIHYAVNCASIGCPNLAQQAYSSARLEEMLEAAARSYVNHPRGFMRTDGKLTASSIYNWYQTDWGDESGVLDHARKYADADQRAVIGDAAGIGGYEYDWSLNEA